MYFSDLGYASYDEYLQSRHWAKLKEQRIKNKNAKCHICGSKAWLLLHHRTYENLGREKKQDLVVLCTRCNKLIHFYDNGMRVPLTYEALTKREKEIWHRKNGYLGSIGKLRPSIFINPVVRFFVGL